MISDDCPEFYSAKDSKAAKPHRCGECRREIAVGETYRTATGKWEGDVMTFKTCSHCLAAAEWLVKACDGWAHEMLAEDLREHFREGYGIWLARAAIGVHRGWKRFDGVGLMKPLTLPADLPVGH